MKKLMMAVAIVCATVSANAAATFWSASWSEATGIYADTEGNPCDPSAPVYLILGSEISQENLVNGFLAGTDDVSSHAAALGSLNDYEIFALEAPIINDMVLSDGAEVYFAIVNGKNLYVSESSFLGKDDVNKDYGAAFDEGGASYSDPLNAYAYNSAWYTAVPEPTSGLLLLLGVAGLALRRRRA